MPIALFGLIALLLLLWLAKSYTKADPRWLAAVLKISGGIISLAVAAFIGVRGHFEVAVPLGLFGLGLLGWGPLKAGFGAATSKSPGQVSRVRSAFLDMELDHDSGRMRGRIIAGSHAGVPLDTLDVSTLTGLLAEIDEESRDLLVAYLDRRSPRWREHAQDGAASGQGGAAHSGKMTQQEAYEILGLQPGASAEEIGRAHRMLMKKLHPDQGGSTYLAARVNQAKDVLLRRHR
ncbi:MAG TPA: DnaJ domain-containing protein [Xanthobacteraceae bacterium]|nr:DnaJ domain-containing protein [Xanthobacteraceae bacterium]